MHRLQRPSWSQDPWQRPIGRRQFLRTTLYLSKAMAPHFAVGARRFAGQSLFAKLKADDQSHLARVLLPNSLIPLPVALGTDFSELAAHVLRGAS